jgi:hypothetical protein
MQTGSIRYVRPWPLIIAVLIVADVTATFETQMILAALKALYADLRDPVAVAWLVTTYLLISSVAAPTRTVATGAPAPPSTLTNSSRSSKLTLFARPKAR